MRWRIYCGLLCGLLVVSMTTARGDVQGARPRDLAVRADGTVLLTSMDSDYVTQMSWNSGTQSFDPPHYVWVGGKTWGIDLLSDDKAIVTLPFRNFLVELNRNPSTGKFERTTTWVAPYYCTDVIKSNWPRRVLVANRGTPPPSGQAWQHAVYELDVFFGTGIKRTFVTDREPRVLALSPDRKRLYVGHAQGALGGPSYDPHTQGPVGGGDHLLSSDDSDGGSVIVFNVEDGTHTESVHRFLIGSPVRGLAVMQISTGYRVFFSHVGFGAAAEDPDFGGRDIANFISSIGFTNSHQPTDRQDFVIGHDPDAEASGDDRPAVLPERLVSRQVGGHHELWITNSGSGSVTRVRLSPAGVADTEFLQQIVFPQVLPGVPRADAGWLLDANITPAASANLDGVVCDSVAQYAVGTIFSNPRGMVYDAANQRVLVATHLEHQLEVIDPTTAGSTCTDGLPATPHALITGANPVRSDEKEFFTFGEAFSFRENEPPFDERLFVFDAAQGGPGIAQEPKTNTITCGTCHVDGHLDGKIRYIVRDNRLAPTAGFRPGENGATIGIVLPSGVRKRAKPVQVPTMFDVGDTEWLFFEGTKTIRDGKSDVAPEQQCEYCFDNGFFFNTIAFTNSLASPISPHAVSGDLTTSQVRGRLLFEAMNCSRCHAGATREVFPRSNNPDTDMPFVGQFGPLPGGPAAQPPHGATEDGGLIIQNRFLHDPTQIFIDGDPGPVGPGGGLSFRNVTDVGTKFSDANVEGVNTPALAGLWDNRPYMHDGRYRTIADVLRNTYVDMGDGHRAASLVLDATPNNSSNTPFETDPDSLSTPPTFAFDTHRQYVGNPPPGRRSVWNYLEGIGATGDFVDFLGAVSSRTELCNVEPDDLFTGYQATPSGCEILLDYTTDVPVETRVQARFLGGGTLTEIDITPLGTSHATAVPTEAAGAYELIVTAYMRTVCLQPLQLVDTVQVAGACNELVNNSPIFTCPQGDTNPLLAITIELDPAQYGTDDIAADRFTVGSPVGGNAMLFPGPGGTMEADSAATLVGGVLRTTITLPFVSGCAVAPDLAALPVLLDGYPVGSAVADIRSADMVVDGVVDLIDVGALGATYGKCQGDPGYDECANFTIVDSCVDGADVTLFVNHYRHSLPEPPGRIAGTVASDMVVNVTVHRPGSPRSHEPTVARVEAENLQDMASLSMILALGEGTGIGDIAWVPNPDLEVASALLPFDAPGESRWVLSVTHLDRIGHPRAELGTIRFTGAAGEPMIEIVDGLVETTSGRVHPLGRHGSSNVPGTPPAPLNYLAGNHPNPLNPTTSIRYSIADDTHVNLSVFNVKGQLVRTLVNTGQKQNEYSVTWDGQDNGGRRLPAGVYFYRLKTSAFTQTRKMVIPR